MPPFKISEQCCDIMKKEPFKRYAKETGRYGMNAVMACESRSREAQLLANGCNAFSAKDPLSMPMAFWMEEDIWSYIRKYNVPYSRIYDMGERRTGCMFCMFGVQFENIPNRFQRMQKTHPKIHSYCMDKLGLQAVLEFIKIPWEIGIEDG